MGRDVMNAMMAPEYWLQHLRVAAQSECTGRECGPHSRNAAVGPVGPEDQSKQTLEDRRRHRTQQTLVARL